MGNEGRDQAPIQITSTEVGRCPFKLGRVIGVCTNIAVFAQKCLPSFRTLLGDQVQFGICFEPSQPEEEAKHRTRSQARKVIRKLFLLGSWGHRRRKYAAKFSGATATTYNPGRCYHSRRTASRCFHMASLSPAVAIAAADPSLSLSVPGFSRSLSSASGLSSSLPKLGPSSPGYPPTPPADASPPPSPRRCMLPRSTLLSTGVDRPAAGGGGGRRGASSFRLHLFHAERRARRTRDLASERGKGTGK